MSNLVTIGEMLMDFREPIDCKETNLYSASVGGSPANVSVQAAKLGTSSSFIGKVGNDHFGKLMKKTLSEYGVSTENLILDSKFLTALAFVNIQDRRRQFTFYRKNCADTQLQFSEVDTSVIDDCKIFHFGSISLTDEPSKSTTIKAVEYAKNSGKIISYDPNWRPNLWASKAEAIEIMQCLLEKVDIIKVSEDELQMLTDCDKLVRGISKLLEFGIKIVVVTQGAKGCIVAGNGEIACMPTYDVKTVDTTGAGDSFYAGFLTKFLESGKEIGDIKMADLREFADFANACGSVCSTKIGGISSMPTREEVENCIKNIKKI